MAKITVSLTPLGSERFRKAAEDAARRTLEGLYPELEAILRAKPACSTEHAYFTAELEGDE